MAMVAKTGLLTEVSASHIDQNPFHQIVLPHGHHGLLCLQPLENLHEFTIFASDLHRFFLRPAPLDGKEFGT